MARLVSLILLATLIVFLAITFFQVIAPFLLPLFLAGVLAILCRPLYLRCLGWTRNRSGWAAGLTTLIVLLILLIPLTAGMIAATTQLYALAQYMVESPRWTESVRFVRLELQSKHVVKQVEEAAGQKLDLVAWREQLNTRNHVERMLSEYQRVTGKAFVIPSPAQLELLPGKNAELDKQLLELAEKSGISIDPAELRKDLLAKLAFDDTLDKAQRSLDRKIDPDELQRQLQARLFFEEVANRLNRLLPSPLDPDKLQDEVQNRIRDVSQGLMYRTLGVAGNTLSILGQIVSFIISLLTFVIALYYFLADGPALLEAAENLVPVHREYKRQLLVQFDQAVRAVVMATFAAALGQGIATGVGMYFCGFDRLDRFLFITLFSTVSALIPLLGTWLVWGPGAAWLAWNGQWGGAIFLTLYGSLFVGTLDNVIRTYVLHSNVKLHPLLAFVSVLGGLQVMGLWGVFVGPIVASCLYALMNIFNHELLAFSQEKFHWPGVAAGPADLPGTGVALAVALPGAASVSAPAGAEPAAVVGVTPAAVANASPAMASPAATCPPPAKPA